MNKDYIVFKNPQLRYRRESFGGVVKIQLKTLIINKRQYELVDSMDKILVYSSLNDVDRKIVDKLVENNIFFRLDLDRAKELGFVVK